MNAALGWIDMLSKQMLDNGQQQRAIEAIQRSLNRQPVLVDDLLDSAAIFSGSLRVERKPVDVGYSDVIIDGPDALVHDAWATQSSNTVPSEASRPITGAVSRA